MTSYISFTPYYNRFHQKKQEANGRHLGIFREDFLYLGEEKQGAFKMNNGMLRKVFSGVLAAVFLQNPHFSVAFRPGP